jgi:endonuclease YncB( thermonuclease family)
VEIMRAVDALHAYRTNAPDRLAAVARPAARTWTYEATIVTIHDGDTLTVNLDHGRHIWEIGAKHRLIGLNAIELHAPGGTEARDHLAALLPPGMIVTLTSYRPYKYGDEWMADLAWPGTPSLAQQLIDTGWAAPWNGLGTAPIPAWPIPTTTPAPTP